MTPSHATPKSMSRRALAHALLIAALPVATGARAQTPLSGPLRFVTPFGPGGTPDVIGRLIGTSIARRADQGVVFDNKPGAGGIAGVNYFASLRHESGAAMLLADVGVYGITPVLRPDARYDVTRDFRPVSAIAKSPLFLMAGPKIPVKSLSDFIAYAKAHPNLNYGTPSPGTPHHLLMEYLKSLEGLKFTHVAWETSAPQLNALLTGEIAFAFTGAPGVRTLMANSPDIKALAAVGAKRSTLLPDVPTFQEQGVGGFDGSALDIRFGVMAAAGTPDPLVAWLNEAVLEAVREPDTSARMAQLGLEPQTGSADEFRALIQSDTAFFRMVAEKTGVTLE